MRISPVPPCDGEGGAQIGFVQGHGLDACALMTKEAIAPIATPAQDTRIPHSMPIEIKMPALSPTMEEGTLAKWLVKEGDTVSAGDLMAANENDKTTMEFDAVDDGPIAKLFEISGAAGGGSRWR